MSARLGLGPALRMAALTPTRLATRSGQVTLAKRFIQVESLPASASTKILNKQRLTRPTSPHATIYAWPITGLTSGTHRATGAALSAMLYSFSLAYLFAPGAFDSVHVVEFVAGLPDVFKYGIKAILATPFVFHSINGVRHLLWDVGPFMTVKGAAMTSWAVIGLSALGTGALIMW